MLEKNREKYLRNQKGFSIPELMVVLLVAAIILVLALPQMISSRRLMKFSAMQRQFSSTLIEARQEAMSQRRAVTFRYDDSIKRITIHGGSFGSFGDVKNKTVELSGFGVGRERDNLRQTDGRSDNRARRYDQSDGFGFKPCQCYVSARWLGA